MTFFSQSFYSDWLGLLGISWYPQGLLRQMFQTNYICIYIGEVYRRNKPWGDLNYRGRNYCQVFDSYVRSSNYALLTIAELPNNELTGIHTLSLPPLLL